MENTRNGEELISIPVDAASLAVEERIILGGMIRKWREEAGLTALDLSEASGVDRKTLRTIENGTRAGQPAKLSRILEALNIPQVTDYDRFTERTRAFIFSAAPIFAQLPDSAKDDAQNDVVTLLVGKLQRAAGIPTIGVGRPGEDERWVAREKDTEPTDEQ